MKAIDNFIYLFGVLDTHITFTFLFALLTLLVAVVLFSYHRKTAVLLLFLGSIGLGFAFAMIDPFLNLWDEKFHALVSKNLASFPLSPHLFNFAPIEYDFKTWTHNYIWLHKPPLSLWQIALSIKLFGANVLAVRLPSVILHALTVVLTYKIGKIAFSSKVGFYGAVLFAILNYPLELIAGIHTAEHIDIAFLFYITASIWAWMEYSRSKSLKWVLIIGVFVGLAILTKWLVGLLVFSGWGIYLITNIKTSSLKEWKHLTVAFLTSLVIAAPWFIFIGSHFPVEFFHEMEYNSLHFTDVIEGHEGDAWFYWHNLNMIYGNGLLISALVVTSILFLWKTVRENKFALVFYVWILLPYLFFTLAVTKMNSFVVIVSPLIILTAAAFVMFLLSYIKQKVSFKKNWILLDVLVFLILIVSILRPGKIIENHYLAEEKLVIRKERTEISEFIKNDIHGGANDIYFFRSTRFVEYIDLMFYHPSFAIDRLPTDAEIQKLDSLGYDLHILYYQDLEEKFLSDSRLQTQDIEFQLPEVQINDPAYEK